MSPASEIRPVRVILSTGPVDSAGAVIPAAPGLLITPYYRRDTPVRGRFTLTHERSGLALADVAMCVHEVRRWAVTAGWIGVDWTADGQTVRDCGPARVLAWRLHEERRPHCVACSPVVG